jgi:WD40 repeat protein
VALSADGKIGLAGRGDTAQLWETATGKPLGRALQHQDKIEALTLRGDGKIALTGSRDNTARLWETATGKPLGQPLQHQNWVVAVALNADGKIALTGSKDKTAKLWETATGKPLGPLLQHQDEVVAVALSADGKIALTGSKDKTARLWHVPQALIGDPECIRLRAQVITGMETDDYGTIRVLDAAAWQDRRQRLQKLGGPPAE